jgi:hypothetical protein
VNARHAITLGLVGWYLMMPPTAKELDSACTGKSYFWNIVGMFASQEGQYSEAIRCNELELQPAADAPFSEWHQVGEFETLAECHSQYNEEQQPPDEPAAASRTIASDELHNEGQLHPSENELSARALEIRVGIHTVAADEKCIASDDPRLKGN